MNEGRPKASDEAAYETIEVRESASARVERELLEYRGNRSLEECYTEIADAIINSDVNHSPELQDLKDIMLERKAVFSTPILLNYSNARKADKPMCASCYIIDADNLSHAEFIDLQNRIFDGAGGLGANVSMASDVQELMHLVERNARARYSGTPTRGCSIGLVCDADSANVDTFVAGQYHDGVGSVESFRHVIRNVMMSRSFLDAARRPESAEQATLRLIASRLISDGTPGILFSDRINEGQPYKIRATNPCAEFLCADNTAAMLSSINLAECISDGAIDHELLSRIARTMALALNVVIDTAGYPSNEIADQTKHYRPIGVSVTNVEHALTELGLSYDSDEARRVVAEVFRVVNQVVDDVDGNTQTTLVAPTGRIGLLLGCKTLALESSLVDQQSELSMMAAVQPYISGGISNTIEYRRRVTEEEIIADIYRAEQLGLKGYSCYINKEYALDIA